MKCVFKRGLNYQNLISIAITILLIVASFAIADTDEEQAAEAEAPKKSPIKIGGAMRLNYVKGTTKLTTKM